MTISLHPLVQGRQPVTPVGGAGCGARGSGFVSRALGRPRGPALRALRPVCREPAGRPEGSPGSQARPEVSAKVSASAPKTPRWSAGRRARSHGAARAMPKGVGLSVRLLALRPPRIDRGVKTTPSPRAHAPRRTTGVARATNPKGRIDVETNDEDSRGRRTAGATQGQVQSGSGMTRNG